MRISFCRLCRALPCPKGFSTFAVRAVLLFTLLLAQLALASNWPAYRHDLPRSAISQDQLSAALNLQWVFTPLHPPKPAWPMPGEETPRMHTDRALHVIVAGDTAYFGSSTDHQLYALEAATGNVRWTFFTEGPVRFEP